MPYYLPTGWFLLVSFDAPSLKLPLAEHWVVCGKTPNKFTTTVKHSSFTTPQCHWPSTTCLLLNYLGIQEPVCPNIGPKRRFFFEEMPPRNLLNLPPFFVVSPAFVFSSR